MTSDFPMVAWSAVLVALTGRGASAMAGAAGVGRSGTLLRSGRSGSSRGRRRLIRGLPHVPKVLSWILGLRSHSRISVTKRHSTPHSKPQAVEIRFFIDAKRDASIVSRTTHSEVTFRAAVIGGCRCNFGPAGRHFLYLGS